MTNPLQEEFWEEAESIEPLARTALEDEVRFIDKILQTLSEKGWIKNDGTYVKKEDVSKEIDNQTLKGHFICLPSELQRYIHEMR